MLNMLIIGGTSAIAQATARHFAADGARFVLVGRDDDKLKAVAADLTARGAHLAQPYLLDMNEFEGHAALWQFARETLGHVDSVLIAHGTLGDQAASAADVETTMQEIRTNFLSVAAFLTHIAPAFERQKKGNITVISSVAGDRGRASNYVYGSAMAGKTAFVSGLRNRLAKSRVSVLTVKPGPTQTPMTAHLPGAGGMADVDQVGKDIYRAMKNGRNVIYTPWKWRWIMAIIRLLPETVFKRLRI